MPPGEVACIPRAGGESLGAAQRDPAPRNHSSTTTTTTTTTNNNNNSDNTI